MLLFHKNKPKDIKGISKHLKFCWQQLFGLLHNITISLKSIRPNKTEIELIAKNELIYISFRARTFILHHPVTNAPTTNPLNYRYCWETRFEILLIIPNRYCRRNARFPVHSSPDWKFQKCAARVLNSTDFANSNRYLSFRDKVGPSNRDIDVAGTTTEMHLL